MHQHQFQLQNSCQANKRRYQICYCNEANKSVQRDRPNKQKNLLDQKTIQQDMTNSQDRGLCLKKRSYRPRTARSRSTTSNPSGSTSPQDKRCMTSWYHCLQSSSCPHRTTRFRSTSCIRPSSTRQQGMQNKLQQKWTPRSHCTCPRGMRCMKAMFRFQL